MAEVGEVDSVVSEGCIQELLEVFSRGNYKARNALDRRNEIIHKRCIHLIARDYDVEVIDNKSGQLCGHYPSELIVIERHKSFARTSSSARHSRGHPVNDTPKLKELISTARYARCRSRFVMPVILFENKNVCRSATLSTMAEMYGRAGMDWFTGGGDTASSSSSSPSSAGGGSSGKDRGVVRSPSLSSSSPSTSGGGRSGGQVDKEEVELMTRVRGKDVQLLKAVGVDLICDLMVEKKKSKYGLLVASSEKVDKWARYCDFQIASMPYPGCEFFREYKEKDFNPIGLHFDWKQSMIDADLLLPEPLQRMTQIPFKSYQEWDLVQITLNYLKLFLAYLQHGKGGLLIHCISGWDRTPLFISLLRLSLWADGKAHSTLSPKEILYFTLAYDWFAFGHPFKDRRDKGEEIMFFCFDFLKYITSDELSVNRAPESCGSPSSGDGLYTPTSVPCQRTFSTHDCCHSTDLGEGWVMEGMSHEDRHPGCDGTPPDCHCGPQGSSVSLTFSPTSQSHHTALCHLGSPSRSCSSYSFSSVPRSQSYSNPLPQSAVRKQQLLAVRTLFQKAYRTAVPELQPATQGGAMAIASGFLSRLPLFGTSSTSNTEV